jgi:hypothetical protein
MHTVVITRTETSTVEVPDLSDLTIGMGDSGPGGEPANRAFLTVDGAHLCYADELSPAALAAFGVLRAEAYQKHLTKLGVIP